jgi:hypothetical protein
VQGVRVSPSNTTGAFDSTNNKVVIAYKDAADTGDGQAFVCTVSGTSISAGSIATFDTNNVTDVSTVFDSNAGKIVISYRDPPTGNGPGTSIIGTVSGTSISFGSKVVFDSTYSYGIASVFDSSSNKVIIAYRDAYVTGNLIVVGTVSGTSISFGTPYRFNTSNNNFNRLIFDTQTNKPILFYKVNGDTEVIGAVVNVSGTSATLGDLLTLNINPRVSTYDLQFVWDSTANKIVPFFSDSANSGHGTSGIVAFPSTTLTSENYIGTAASGAADTQRAKINLKGAVDENQSGLTAGQSYYVQTDGTLGTTPADPSVFAGTAVAATKLIVKG